MLVKSLLGSSAPQKQSRSAAVPAAICGNRLALLIAAVTSYEFGKEVIVLFPSLPFHAGAAVSTAGCETYHIDWCIWYSFQQQVGLVGLSPVTKSQVICYYRVRILCIYWAQCVDEALNVLTLQEWWTTITLCLSILLKDLQDAVWHGVWSVTLDFFSPFSLLCIWNVQFPVNMESMSLLTPLVPCGGYRHQYAPSVTRGVLSDVLSPVRAAPHPTMESLVQWQGQAP